MGQTICHLSSLSQYQSTWIPFQYDWADEIWTLLFLSLHKVPSLLQHDPLRQLCPAFRTAPSLSLDKTWHKFSSVSSSLFLANPFLANLPRRRNSSCLGHWLILLNAWQTTNQALCQAHRVQKDLVLITLYLFEQGTSDLAALFGSCEEIH